ncbi:hypothetical protein ACAG26_13355 [Mycobacterium sp. pUA109]|uniref:hypothetical protein n=1 Tax=Mycobacterium sp. pUA109 TaxID=3238982 RepID=UPI00351B97AC
MPSTSPVVSRRHVLAGGVALALLGVAVSACSSTPEPEVDDLEAQLELARHDSALATAAAAAADPSLAAALTTVAAQRSDHAQALATEIARAAGQPAPTSSAASTSPSATAQAGPPPTLPDVINALHTSADSAGTVAASSSGYRAGLLGSIAAACTVAYTVALASGETGS